MGVGHTTIGSGRIINQYLNRINNSIKYGYIEKNKIIIELLNKIKKNKKIKIHLLGMLSPGGIHSHENHIFSLIKIFNKVKNTVLIHIFSDGRDCGIKSLKTSIEKLKKYSSKNVILASISGRYYAMDRNKNWDRTKLVYDMLVSGESKYNTKNALNSLSNAYKRNETDEFIYPSWCCEKKNRIKNYDII